MTAPSNMFEDIQAAICALWNADSILSGIPLYNMLAPKTCGDPYAVMHIMTETINVCQGKSYVITIELHIYSSTGTAQQVQSLMNTAITLIENGGIPITLTIITATNAPHNIPAESTINEREIIEGTLQFKFCGG
jgi:hypothetical protein